MVVWVVSLVAIWTVIYWLGGRANQRFFDPN
jgi:hypothetical protein